MIKTLHIATALLSGGLFFARGLLMVRDSALLQRWWLKIPPHIIDTLLLVSAVALAVTTQQYPLEQSWLTAKVVALCVYIGLGLVALRFGKTKRVRVGAWIGALAAFAYILSVAVTRHPLPVPL